MLKALPNILTFVRLVLSVIFLIMILYCPHVENRSFFLDIAFVLFVVAGLTDVVDGHVARRFNATSKFGRMIDPLVDKVLVCGAFICFAVIGEPKLFSLSSVQLAVVHWLVVAVLLSREVYVTVLRHLAEAKGVNFAATASGKIKMLLQTFAIGTVLVKMAHVPEKAWGNWFTTITFVAMVVATVVSGVLATRRSSWQQSQTEGRPHESSSVSA
ncbi:MAG: CDP-alcohol phosphatidyltransferase family protein [Planctomycetota bacterium]|jgi:CDP-diacylglycerol--glycerol-3-phosphate 3-phosphatidyltransferase